MLGEWSWGGHDCCQMHFLSPQARHDVRGQLILMLPDLNWCSPRESSEFIFLQWEIPQEKWTSGRGQASDPYCRASSHWLTAAEAKLIISSLWFPWGVSFEKPMGLVREKLWQARWRYSQMLVCLLALGTAPYRLPWVYFVPCTVGLPFRTECAEDRP